MSGGWSSHGSPNLSLAHRPKASLHHRSYFRSRRRHITASRLTRHHRLLRTCLVVPRAALACAPRPRPQMPPAATRSALRRNHSNRHAEVGPAGVGAAGLGAAAAGAATVGAAAAAGAGARALPKVGEAAAAAARAGARALPKVGEAAAAVRAMESERALPRSGRGKSGQGICQLLCVTLSGGSTKTSRCSLRLGLRPTRTGGRASCHRPTDGSSGHHWKTTCFAPDATQDGTLALSAVLTS